jgi:hypothetical protein
MEATDRRSFLRDAASWWDSDRNRLSLIRGTAYLLFVMSVGGTIYAGVTGALPAWALTLYAAFTVQLVFMTFMYAIKHSGVEEIRHALYTLRKQRVAEWQMERTMLVEMVRLGFCATHDLDPGEIAENLGKRVVGQGRDRSVWPEVNWQQQLHDMLCSAVSAHVHPEEIAEPPNELHHVDHATRVVELDLIYYSSETTLLDLTREFTTAIEDVIGKDPKRFHARLEVRVLVRDTSEEHAWLVPVADDEDDDIRYSARLRTRFTSARESHIVEFHDQLKELLPLREQLVFRARMYRAEPLIKGAMINRAEGAFGLYGVNYLTHPPGFDYSGHGVVHCPCRLDGSPTETAAAKFFNYWFHRLWEDQSIPIE